MEVAPGVHRLTLGVVNWYLVEEGGRAVAVDAGTPRDWPLLLTSLESLGLPPERLEAILLTHAHPDHVGFAERARREAGASVRVHEADASVARGERPGKNERGLLPYLLRAEAYRTTFSLLRRGGGRIIPVAEVSTVADGETLDLPARPQVIHAPGHTPGSCALGLEGRRVVLTGDVLVTRNPLTGRVGPQIMPAALNRDSRQAMASLDGLESLEADLLLPGHGEPWGEGVAEAVRRARTAGFS